MVTPKRRWSIIAAQFVAKLPSNYVVERNYLFPFIVMVRDGILTNVSILVIIVIVNAVICQNILSAVKHVCEIRRKSKVTSGVPANQNL